MADLDQDRNKLATYRIDGNKLLKTVDGTNWKLLFTYNDEERLREISRLLNNSAIGNCEWLRRELKGEPTTVLACDECPVLDIVRLICKHPLAKGKSIEELLVSTRRPSWCPLDRGHPLYLQTLNYPS